MNEKDSKEKDLENVKTFIRSVLITEKDGFTVRELNNLYCELLGERIPHTKFGFTTIESFLHSINDTVRFVTARSGEERVKHVSVEATKHIEEMVSKQKASSKKKKPFNSRSVSGPCARRGRGRGRGGGNSFRGRSNIKPQNFQTGGLLGRPPLLRAPNTYSYQQDRDTSQYNANKLERPPRFSRPQVSSAYRFAKWPGSDFEAYDSVHSRTRNAGPDIQSGTENQRHGETRRQNSLGGDGHQDRLSLQEASDSSLEHERPYSFRGRSRGRGRTFGVDRRSTQLDSQQDTGYFGGARPKFPGYSSAQSFSSDSESFTFGSDQDDDDELERDTKGELFTTQEENCEVSQDVQNKVKQVLLKAPKGLWANRLPVMYKEMFDKNFPMREQGFHSVIAMMSAMPHIVRIVRPYEQGDWMLFDASLPQDAGDEPVNKREVLAARINQSPGELLEDRRLVRDEELKESVRQVLQAHTDGVALHLFPDIYLEMTGRMLNPKAYGEEDMNSLLVLLSGHGVLRMEYSGPDSMFPESSRLYAKATSDVRHYNYLKDGYKPHSFECVVTEKQQSFDDQCYQQDVVGPGVCYKPAVIDDLKKGDGVNKVFYELIVSNVVSPGLFWVQKRKDNAFLDDLMDGLESAYKQQSDLYRMPQSMMHHGQVCATLFPEDNNWHRAVITGGTPSMVEVYFVDYGNTCCVPSNTVYFLKKKFVQLPVQAIQAKMATLVPPTGHKTFTRESKQALLDMVISRPLMALILDIQNRVLSLLLVDTNGANDIHINDQLVAQGHAQWEETRPAGREDTVLNPIYSEGQRFVRQVICSPEIGFHTIHLAGSLYVTSPEVSGLFWEDDILASMLQQSSLGVPVPKVVIHRQHCPGLFEELYSYGVYFVDQSTQMLSLYSLDCLPLLLDLFGNQSAAVDELKDFVMQHLEAFDPNDLYWKGIDEDVASEGTDVAEDDGGDDGELSLKELEMALHSMQINRKRILQRMTSGSECRADDIRALEKTEKSINILQGLIQTLEEQHTGTIPGVGESESTATSSKTVAPLPKAASSSLTSDTVTSPSVKTNIVAPMVKPPPSPPADQNVLPVVLPGSRSEHSSLLPNPPPVGNLDQMAATNEKLEALIRQQDKILQGMLGQGGGLAAPSASGSANPGSSLAPLEIGGASLQLHPPVIQNQGQPESIASQSGLRNPVGQPVPMSLAVRHPQHLQQTQHHPQLLMNHPPPPLPFQSIIPNTGHALESSLGHPMLRNPSLPPSIMLGNPPHQPMLNPGGPFPGGYLPHRAALIAPSAPTGPADAMRFSTRFLPPSGLPVRSAGPGMMGMAVPAPMPAGPGQQAVRGGGGGGGNGGGGLAAMAALQQQLHQRQVQHQQLLMRHQHLTGTAPQLAASFNPEHPSLPLPGDATLAYSPGPAPADVPFSSSCQGQSQGEGGSQLLPGMLPLLQSFKASCAVKPTTVVSSASSSG